MSQRLRIMSRKDGKARGVAIRKTNATKNPNTLQTLFNMAYQQHLRKQNGKSKSKTS